MTKQSKNMSLLVCALLHGLNHALQLILPPLYLAIRDDLALHGLSPVMLFGTVYFVTYAAVGLPFGVLSDRFSKKKILIFGAGLNSGAFLIAAYTDSYAVFMASMILAGIGGGTYHPVGNALISNIFSKTIGRAFGLIGMGACLGLFAGPLASGIIAHQFNWRISCTVFAVFGLLVTVAFQFFMPDEEKDDRGEERQGMPLGTFARVLLPIIVVFALRDFCHWGTTYLTPAMTQLTLGFSERTAGILLAVMNITGIVSQPIAGTLSDRIGRRPVIAVALLVGAISVFTLPFLGSTLVFAAIFISGFTLLSTVPVIDAAAADVVPPSVRGRLFGVMMSFGIMFGAVSPYCMGLIHDLMGGYFVAYLVLATAGLAGSAMVLTFPGKKSFSRSK
jgi:MFS family permease